MISEAKCLVLGGLPASGKTTAAYRLEHLGCSRVDVGSLFYQSLGRKVPRELVGPTFVERFGRSAISANILARVAQLDSDAVVDAIRFTETYLEMRETMNEAVELVYVEAPEAARRSRLLARYPYRDAGAETLIAAQSQYDADILKLKPFATAVIENDGSIDSLCRKVSQVFEEITMGRA